MAPRCEHYTFDMTDKEALAYAREQMRKGNKQIYCQRCGKWFYPEFWFDKEIQKQ